MTSHPKYQHRKLSGSAQKDVSKICGIPEENVQVMIGAYHDYILPPYRDWPEVLSTVGITKHSRVLDLACSNGRTAVDIAKRCSTHVTGVDVVPQFIDFAKKYAKRKGVDHLCTFRCADARQAMKRYKDFDVVFWLSAPHLWGSPDKTIAALRSCARDGGFIVLYDAYYLPGVRKQKDTWYSKEVTTRKLEQHGDSVVQIMDEGNSEWAPSYAEDRRIYARHLARTSDPATKQIIRSQLDAMKDTEKWEREHFGTAFWIVQKRERRHSLHLI